MKIIWFFLPFSFFCWQLPFFLLFVGGHNATDIIGKTLSQRAPTKGCFSLLTTLYQSCKTSILYKNNICLGLFETGLRTDFDISCSNLPSNYTWFSSPTLSLIKSTDFWEHIGWSKMRVAWFVLIQKKSWIFCQRKFRLKYYLCKSQQNFGNILVDPSWECIGKWAENLWIEMEPSSH